MCLNVESCFRASSKWSRIILQSCKYENLFPALILIILLYFYAFVKKDLSGKWFMQDALFNIYAILFNRNVVQIYWMTGVIWVKLNGFKALSCPVCVSWVDVQVPCSSRSSGLTDACALCREARFWWWRMDRARPQSSACRPSPRNSRRRYRRWDFPQTLLLHMGTEISDLCLMWLYQTQ